MSTLKLYLQLGLKLKNVKRCIKYTQKPYLKDYIDFNTQKRAVSKTDYEKDFYKLMNNAVFGKTMENVRGRIDIRFATEEDKFEK